MKQIMTRHGIQRYGLKMLKFRRFFGRELINTLQNNKEDINYDNTTSSVGAYVSKVQYQNVSNDTLRTITLMYQNLRSLKNKLHEIQAYICDKKLDILCVSEHWLDGSESAELKISGLVVGSIFCREESRGGGVTTLLDSTIEHNNITKISKFSIEKIIELCCAYIKSLNIYIFCVYRSPGESIEVFVTQLGRAIDSVGHRRKIIIVGDFNVLFGTKQSESVLVNDMLESYGFRALVSAGTRGGNCIDNLFINFDVLFTDIKIIDNGLSDHNLIELRFGIDSDTNNKTLMRKYRPITERGKQSFFTLVQEYNWSFISKNNINVSTKCKLFCDKIQEAFDASFPEKIYKNKQNQTLFPWFNDTLREMRERLCFLNDLFKQYPSQELLDNRNCFKKQYRRAIKVAKREYNDRLISNSTNKSKSIWKIVNNNRANKQKQNPSMTIDPDAFNDFFSSVADVLVGNGQCSTQDIPFRITHLPDEEFKFGDVGFNEVRDVILNLKNKDSRDKFGFSVRIIKMIRELILIPLTKIINLCFRECIFPCCLKEAVVVPVFKKGDKNDISNYRPISLLPVFSKIIEKCMASRMALFLEENLLLNDQQFGFRSGRSTVLAILDLVSFILDGFESREHVGAVFCDLSKAFDCVSHELLIKKLDYYKFSEGSVALLKSYMEDRIQRVVVDGVWSNPRPLKNGVPQGSVLGPLLFLIYINNLPHIRRDDHYVLFADDTAVSVRGKELKDLEGGADDAQARAADWFRKNNLVLNEAKTNRVIFSLRSVPEDCRFSRESVPFLGVQLDSEMRWNAHIEQLCKKLRSALFVLRNLSGTVSYCVLRTAYYALFHSVMSYAVLAWGHAPQWRRVFALQRRAVRVVGGLGYRDDCRETFKMLNILTLPNLYILENLLYVKANTEKYPTNAQHGSHDTRRAEHLSIPIHRLERSRDGPRYWGVKFYNKLPDGYKLLSDKVFKGRVRGWLLENPLYDSREFLSSDIHINLT